jgi:uncharacterized protein (TIGR02246 family)
VSAPPPIPPEYPPFDRPERMPEIWAAAWNRRDPETLAALFDEDAEFVNVTGLWWHDRAAILKAHRYGLSVIFNESELTLRRVTVKWLRDDVAVVHARMRLTGQTPVAGVERPGARTTVFSFVVHRTDGRWSCASAHNTDVVPGMETHLVADDGSFRSVDYRKE